MEFEIEKAFHNKEEQCKAIALHVGGLDPAILAIALIGGCARGALFPEDIDFLILVDDAGHISRLEHLISGDSVTDDGNYSFIFYTPDNLESLVARRQHNLRMVQLARYLTRKLRHMRALKKMLISLLGHRKTYFQMKEVLPQSFQTAIPLYDPDSRLADLQQSQASQLRNVLTRWEREFYSPYGFHKLLDGYLSEEVDLSTVRSILRNCDIDSEDYVERLAVYYDESQDVSRAQRCRVIFHTT